MNRVKGKVALITGAAMGIGQACAEVLATEGAAVVLSDVNVATGKDAATAIEKALGQAIFCEHDVGDEKAWQRVVSETIVAYGRLDILVNNAGIGVAGEVEHASLGDWERTLRVNLTGVFLGIKHVIPAMCRTGGGSIINLSSIEGLVGDPTLAAYNASKGGVRLLTKSAALYCAHSGYGIRVNSVHPGYIWTPMVEGSLRASGDLEAGRKRLESLHPVGHLGEPNDIAYGVLYLASDESKFVTGAELVIDGGYTAQ
ncbi:MAG TPA: glucose 1-dehydrogenase [Thermoanaerobaculaceae bacterium]|nr:glucose 1-dehydrogenase [Thermoanaerobaculaceae bacterium]